MQGEVLESPTEMKSEMHLNTFSTMFGRACTWYELGRFEDPESLMKEAARLRESVSGELHQYTTEGINNLARWKEKRMRREKREVKEENYTLPVINLMLVAWISDDEFESPMSKLTPLGDSDDGVVDRRVDDNERSQSEFTPEGGPDEENGV